MLFKTEIMMTQMINHDSDDTMEYERIEWVSEGLNLTASLGTADSEVPIVHISHVTVAYTLESLSSLT